MRNPKAKHFSVLFYFTYLVTVQSQADFHAKVCIMLA